MNRALSTRLLIAVFFLCEIVRHGVRTAVHCVVCRKTPPAEHASDVFATSPRDFCRGCVRSVGRSISRLTVENCRRRSGRGCCLCLHTGFRYYQLLGRTHLLLIQCASASSSSSLGRSTTNFAPPAAAAPWTLVSLMVMSAVELNRF